MLVNFDKRWSSRSRIDCISCSGLLTWLCRKQMRRWTHRCFVTSRTVQTCEMRWYFFFNFCWSIVDLQCCVSFRYIAKWISMKWSFQKTLCPCGCLSFASSVCVLTSCHQPVPTPCPQLCVYKSSLSSSPPSWGPKPVCLWWRSTQVSSILL